MGLIERAGRATWSFDTPAALYLHPIAAMKPRASISVRFRMLEAPSPSFQHLIRKIQATGSTAQRLGHKATMTIQTLNCGGDSDDQYGLLSKPSIDPHLLRFSSIGIHSPHRRDPTGASC